MWLHAESRILTGDTYVCSEGVRYTDNIIITLVTFGPPAMHQPQLHTHEEHV